MQIFAKFTACILEPDTVSMSESWALGPCRWAFTERARSVDDLAPPRTRPARFRFRRRPDRALCGRQPRLRQQCPLTHVCAHVERVGRTRARRTPRSRLRRDPRKLALGVYGSRSPGAAGAPCARLWLTLNSAPVPASRKQATRRATPRPWDWAVARLALASLRSSQCGISACWLRGGCLGTQATSA